MKSPFANGFEDAGSQSPPSLPNPSQNNHLAFPMRLHEMIQWVENNYPHSSRPIHWLDSGRAFTIRDHDALATKILSQFFKKSKIESFARKLNRWGFSIIKSGPEKGAYMHKDFVRWEEPFSITSMSKDRRRKLKPTSSKASSTAEEDSPPQNKPTCPTVGNEDDRKMPSQNEDDAKNDPFRPKRTWEAIYPSGQYQQQTSSPDSRVRRNQAVEKTPSSSHGNSNSIDAVPGGGSIRRSTNEHMSWNEGIFSWSQAGSFLNTDKLEIQDGEQSFQLIDSIGTNTMTSEHSSRAAGDTNVNNMLTSFNHAPMATINSMTMPTTMLTTNSTMHGIEVRNVSDFVNNNMNIYHHWNEAITNNYRALEIKKQLNIPSAQPGQINSTIYGNANKNTKSFSNNMMPRPYVGMMAVNDDAIIPYNTQSNAAMHGLCTTDIGIINFHTSSNNMNVACSSDIYKEDILAPLALFSPDFDRDVIEGRITFTTAATARNEDCNEDTKGASTTREVEDLDEDQIDRDLRNYFQQLEKSISSEEETQRRL